MQANGTETDSMYAKNMGKYGVETNGMSAAMDADEDANGVEPFESVSNINGVGMDSVEAVENGRHVDGVDMDGMEAGDNAVNGDVNAVEANVVAANNDASISNGSKRPGSAGTHEMVCSALIPDLLSSRT